MLSKNKIKYIHALNTKKKRNADNVFVAEGPKTVGDILARQDAKCLIATQQWFNDNSQAMAHSSENIVVTEDELQKASLQQAPQQVIAVFEQQHPHISATDISSQLVLALDGVQDPGNLGTIIRSAVAFNIDTVILSKNTVDLYNPKTIRATQGMFFHINVIKKDLLEVMKYLDDIDVPVYGTLVEHGEDVRTLNEKDKKKFALIVGNEGNGVHKEISDKCDKNLYIKMNSDVESLNVGVATSILLYELGR